MFVDTRVLLEIIEGLDWYHINKRGELVHGAENENEALYKAKDIYNLIDMLGKEEDL